MRNLLRSLQGVILAHPIRVVWASLALTALALWLGSGVEFRTSRADLAGDGDPDQLRMDRLTAEFSGSTTLIAAVEARTPPGHDDGGIRAFVDALAAEIAQDPLIDNVYCKISLEWLLRHGLYLVPADYLERMLEAAEHQLDLLPAIPTLNGFETLNRMIADRMESGMNESTSLPDERAAEGVGWLVEVLRAEREFFEDPARFVDALSAQDPVRLLAGEAATQASDTYLTSDDGRVVYVMINPRTEDDRLPVLRDLMGRMRGHAGRVERRLPGYRVAFTGTPAITVEEMRVVRTDTWRAAGIAVFGVTLLTFFVFRWKTHALFVLAALAAGVVWSFGAVRLELGYLNMLTSSFVSTLVGVGVAYGIHPVSEYELQGAHTRGALDAVRAAYHNTGAAVATAAVTTSVAFFSIMLMRFPGFAEMGLVAGVGVLLCLLAALVTLPAIIVVFAGRRRGAGRNASVVDRLWIGRVSGAVCRFPRTTSVVALALTALAGWAAFGIRFSNNILEMLPTNAESLREVRRMIEGSDLSPVFNMVVADDLEQLRAMRVRAEDEPSVERFESVLRLLPERPERSAQAVGRLATFVRRLELPTRAMQADRSGLAGSLRRLEGLFDEAADAAFSAGLPALLERLEDAAAEAAGAREAVERAPSGQAAVWRDGQQRILDYAHDLLDQLLAMTEAGPPRLQELPEELRRRFVTSRGKLIGYLYPSGDVFDPPSLATYVAASRRVDPAAIGFPYMLWKTSHRITSGFYTAVAVGLVLVALVLVIDYRNLRHAGLAMIPLCMGVIWMLGGMRLLGLNFNFANLVAVPLIIGAGIDNGVHVIHRVLHEGREGMGVVLQHTGRAILIASLTTMIGFGSLALASHRGLASLGLTLLIGVFSCLVTSTIVLPNLLVALGTVRR